MGLENTFPETIVGATSLLPSSLDYYAMGKVTSIKNQANCGCCWSFASTAVYESQLLIHYKSSYGLSDEANL